MFERDWSIRRAIWAAFAAPVLVAIVSSIVFWVFARLYVILFIADGGASYTLASAPPFWYPNDAAMFAWVGGRLNIGLMCVVGLPAGYLISRQGNRTKRGYLVVGAFLGLSVSGVLLGRAALDISSGRDLVQLLYVCVLFVATGLVTHRIIHGRRVETVSPVESLSN